MSDDYAGGMSFSRPAQQKGSKLHQRWQTLDNKKTAMYRRCEDYAMWTLPYVFPILGTKDTEQQGPVDSTGPRAVNNVSNKLVMTLFAPYQPFFRLNVSSDVINDLNHEATENQDEDAKAVLDNLDKTLAQAEKSAMELLDYNRFRTEATMVAKALVVTGNSLMYHPDTGRVQSYGLRDYCVVRDLAGTVIEILTRDKKAFATFTEEVQKQIRDAGKGKKYKDTSDVTIYTQICLKEDGKYHMKQDADDFALDSTATWTPEELPYITLTWNLVRGEDYGRGLVEDYAGAFHGLYVLNNALVDMVGIAADIKFLVDPASVLDVKALNDSESGTYHTGKEGDITVPQFNKQFDMQFVMSAIERFQNQIGQAFLLNSSVVRDAERVTQEEIRFVAQELEVSHGGVYSRFAEEWQLRLAILLLRRLDFKIGGTNKTIYPQIITGLDSLSRAGDLDNLRMFISDLQTLEAVPEEIRGVIDPLRFAQYIGVRRGVDYEKFTKTADQLKQEQAAAMQQQQAALNMQAQANISEEAGKAAVQQT